MGQKQDIPPPGAATGRGGRVRESTRRMVRKLSPREVRERLRAKRLREPSLDAVNFLISDVQGALGPYVSVFLVANQHWNVGDVGLVTTIGGWIGLVMQTPIGALIDRIYYKRGLINLGLVVLGLGGVTIALFPSFVPVLGANVVMQMASGIFGPGVAALTVGLYARDQLTRRMGRNAAFARAGNMLIAGITGVVGWYFSPRAVFFQVPIFAALAIVAVLTIPVGLIDQRRARGLRPDAEGKDQGKEQPGSLRVLISCTPLLVFGICNLLYELADAPLLTLVGQELGVTHKGWGIVLTSGLIVASQAGMVPVSILVARKADQLGQRWLLAVSFLALPVQGVLTVVSHNIYWLTALQFFGGMGTGLLTALVPLVLADIMQGTGRYNLAQGAVNTMRAIGVTASGMMSEYVLAAAGYNAAYLTCTAIGGLALALLWFAMPETGTARSAPAVAQPVPAK